MVYRVSVGNVDDVTVVFSIMTRRKHSYNDLEELVKIEVPEYNTNDYYFEYIEL